MRWHWMGWDGMGLDGVGCDGIGWDRMGWDGIGWGGMRWHWMGWDWIGLDWVECNGTRWDGMGWDAMGYDECDSMRCDAMRHHRCVDAYLRPIPAEYEVASRVGFVCLDERKITCDRSLHHILTTFKLACLTPRPDDHWGAFSIRAVLDREPALLDDCACGRRRKECWDASAACSDPLSESSLRRKLNLKLACWRAGVKAGELSARRLRLRACKHSSAQAKCRQRAVQGKPQRGEKHERCSQQESVE